MLILPAIDLIKGECVRLTQGDYNRKKTYDKDPANIAKIIESQGATFLHVVDLDGATVGYPFNLSTIKEIKLKTGLSLQVGGGIRSSRDANEILKLGADRLIIGTAATDKSKFLSSLLKKYGPERIIVSIDARDEFVLTKGWSKNSGKKLTEFLKQLKRAGVKTVIFTDVKRDGMLKGPNFVNIKKVVSSGLNVIVAGGISTERDLARLDKLGAYGAIIGKALYEKRIDLARAVKKFQKNNLAKRIIPCMDIKDNRVVKGTYFQGLNDAGDPVELGKKYSEMGADELVFLDITATVESRKTLSELVRKIAQNIDIPFTVGGGIKSVEDIRILLNSGADKISIGSAAVRTPKLISGAAKAFGSQCVVISVDAKRNKKNGWDIYIDGGRTNTGLDAIRFSEKMEELGAGELLVNSLDRDGTNKGYDLELLKKIVDKVNIPVIASSGAGKKEDFLDAFRKSNVDAALAAGIFHYGKIKISSLKTYLKNNKITIRI